MIVPIRKNIPREPADAVVANPTLIGINHAEISLPSQTTRAVARRTYLRMATAAAVSASCDETCVQSRNPRTKAPVGSLYGTTI